MECKDGIDRIHAVVDEVLIETLWNVKVIETRTTIGTGTGFNRNIVECKGADELFWTFFSRCFNRNIVECKDENYNKNKEHLDVLIETLWNVKPHRSYLEPFFGSVLIETLWNVKQQKGLTLSMLRWF